MPRKLCLELCAVANCYSTQHTSTLFKFPRDPTAARVWTAACKRQDFDELIDLYGFLMGSYKLCALHFTSDQFMNPRARNKKLKTGAVPTIFKKGKDEDNESGNTLFLL